MYRPVIEGGCDSGEGDSGDGDGDSSDGYTSQPSLIARLNYCRCRIIDILDLSLRYCTYLKILLFSHTHTPFSMSSSS